MARVAGLTNVGNSCFMNASLQAMSNLPPIQYVLESKVSLITLIIHPNL